MMQQFRMERAKKPGLRLAAAGALMVAGLCGTAQPAHAQLDPLLFLKRTKPNLIVAVETTNRMQHDADGVYYDPFDYQRTGEAFEMALGVDLLNTVERYRRKYVNLVNTDPSMGTDRFAADRIVVVGDRAPDYATWDRESRLAVARAGLAHALQQNVDVIRIGLIKTRQSNARIGAAKNEGPVNVLDPMQQLPTETGQVAKWRITRPEVDAANSSIGTITAPLVSPDAAGANTTVLSTLSKRPNEAGALVPAGRDSRADVDAPLKRMLDDARAEAVRLIAADTHCRNTAVVLVVGGGEGTLTSADDAATVASTFLSVSGRRVPIYVVAIAPEPGSVSLLQAIARNSGGTYSEISPAMIAAAAGHVHEVARAVNAAVQHVFADQSDFDAAPTVYQPCGPATESLVTSPIVGTVNLESSRDIEGAALVNSRITSPATGNVIPQRANVMVTSGFSLPGFEGRLRAFRVYRPVADSTKTAGYKFVADGTRLWVASTPPASQRNIYTALPDGTMIPFTEGNAALLAPYLRTSDPAALIQLIRNLPLGAVVGSTPAFLDPPSLDPPPDPDYPGFAAANAGRRSLVFVGGNNGLLHAIDGRLGVEAWGFIPFNLLPKLRALLDGQPVGDFRHFMDSSPKVADVKVNGEWRTYLIVGEGPGGTFYQTFDVTLPGMASWVSASDDNISSVLSYFSDAGRVPLKWAFPRYSSFDWTIGEYGDIGAGATAAEKSVGETWSDPAVGQVESSAGRQVVLVGSGFFPYSSQQQPNRGGVVAGTAFYMFDAGTGELLDWDDVGNDGAAETLDSCGIIDCRRMKNALQADPVATGPPESRFITKAYIGDLDGQVWRFDIGLDENGATKFKSRSLLYSAGATHPLFSSMASVNVGGTHDYLFFGTGSDLLPGTGVSQSYKLLGVLDQAGTGSIRFDIPLEATDGALGDEKVSAFPAVAGDIVFFSTTVFRPASPCTPPDARLYALTFLGGPAYDTTGDNRITSSDSTRVQTITGARATAPFVADQHVMFAAGGNIEMFGDPEDFNNGVGQVGVRILSWRELR
jgi:regulator of extracellular matrix RemA (YlzA/DUF370 family)